MALSSNQYALKVQSLEKTLAQKAAPNSARMAKSLRFAQGQRQPAFSEKVQRGDERKFFKNRPIRCPRVKGPNTHWRKWYYPLISMHLKCIDWKRFRHKQRLKKGPNGEVMVIFGRSPKTCIFKKSPRGRPREVFQKSPKKQPSFERRKSTLAQKTSSFIQYALEVQRLQKILAQKADPKVPEWLSYGNSRKVTQNPHFLKKCKGGTKGNFSKITQKVALPSKTQQHSGASGIIP